jgi:RimJ/RimL family protein N-acetyltransferase
MTGLIADFDGFRLTRVGQSDLDLLAHWRSDPEVYLWYGGEPPSVDYLREHFVEEKDVVTHCIVHHDQAPLGFLQFYRYDDPEWRARVGLDDDAEAWGIDLFIANPADRDCGLGTRLVAGTARWLALEHGAPLVLIDPHVDNLRAVRAYQKAGFETIRLLPDHEEHAGQMKDAWLMAWRPADLADLPAVGHDGIPGERAATTTPPEETAPRRLLRRTVRQIILLSIVVNAVLGIWALGGDLGTFQARVLATSLLITAVWVVGLACGTAITTGRLGYLPQAGIAAAVVAGALIIAAVWNEFDINPLWQTGGTLATLAVTVAYISLMSAAHAEGQARRIQIASYVLAVLVAAMTIAIYWGATIDEGVIRSYGISWVLLGAATVAVPIMVRLQAPEELARVAHCPFCGAEVHARLGRGGRCEACGERFRVLGR